MPSSRRMGIKSDSCTRADPFSAHLLRRRRQFLPMSRTLLRKKDPQYRNRPPTSTSGASSLSTGRLCVFRVRVESDSRLASNPNAHVQSLCPINVKKSAPHLSGAPLCRAKDALVNNFNKLRIAGADRRCRRVCAQCKRLVP